MTFSRQAASGRKQARRFAAALPRRLVRKGDVFIPSSVLKQLAEMQLPKDRRIYTARLNELLRSA